MEWMQYQVKWFCKEQKNGGQGRNRTADASLFRAALYRLSYLAFGTRKISLTNRRSDPYSNQQPLYTGWSCSKLAAVADSTPA